MASTVGHWFVGRQLGCLFYSDRRVRMWSIVCSLLPDIDVLWAVPFGIEEGLLRHRGITHSVPVAFIFGCAIAWLLFRTASQTERSSWRVMAAWFTSLMIFHDLLDGMVVDGPGVMYFAPFTMRMSELPIQFIPDAPIALEALAGPLWMSLMVEIPLVLALTFVMTVMKRIATRRRARALQAGHTATVLG